MEDTKQVVLTLNFADAAAISLAVEERARWDAASGDCRKEDGALLAEICRDWLERVEANKKRLDQSLATAESQQDDGVSAARSEYLEAMQRALRVQMDAIGSLRAVEQAKTALTGLRGKD